MPELEFEGEMTLFWSKKTSDRSGNSALNNKDTNMTVVAVFPTSAHGWRSAKKVTMSSVSACQWRDAENFVLTHVNLLMKEKL